MNRTKWNRGKLNVDLSKGKDPEPDPAGDSTTELHPKALLPHVFRFAITDGSGRYSGEWRVWTGSRKPTNETYIAPRSSGGKLKISLHSDGTGQVGFTKPVREQLYVSDRGALDRWHQDPSSDRAAFFLFFHRSELREDTQPEANTSLVTLERDDKAFCVIIHLFENQTTLGDQFGAEDQVRVLAVLGRASKGIVAILGYPVPLNPTILADAKEFLATPMPSWAPPADFGWEKFAFAAVGHGDDPRGYLEFNVEVAPPEVVQPGLHEFPGTVMRWMDLPVPTPQDLPACAALRVTQESEAFLYFNDHSRCDHESLVAYANQCLQWFKTDGPDGRWHAEGDGSWVTFLMTPAAEYKWSSGEH